MIKIETRKSYRNRYGVWGVFPIQTATCDECGWKLTAGWINPEIGCLRCRNKVSA